MANYNKKNGKKGKYSQSQKQAYYSGMGYRVAHSGKGIEFKSPEIKISFQAGYREAGKKIQKSPKKYPDLKR